MDVVLYFFDRLHFDLKIDATKLNLHTTFVNILSILSDTHLLESN